MLVINDFFVRYKEAVSNQMELIAKANKGKIVYGATGNATRRYKR